MRKIGKDETFSRAFEVGTGRTVNIAATIKPSDAADVRYAFECVMDFEGVSVEEMRVLAARTVWINDVQRRFRTAYNSSGGRGLKAEDFEKVSVREYLDRERKKGGGPRDPLKVALGSLDKMTDAQKAELLKALQAK